MIQFKKVRCHPVTRGCIVTKLCIWLAWVWYDLGYRKVMVIITEMNYVMHLYQLHINKWWRNLMHVYIHWMCVNKVEDLFVKNWNINECVFEVIYMELCCLEDLFILVCYANVWERYVHERKREIEKKETEKDWKLKLVESKDGFFFFNYTCKFKC